eukprot:403350960
MINLRNRSQPVPQYQQHFMNNQSLGTLEPSIQHQLFIDPCHQEFQTKKDKKKKSCIQRQLQSSQTSQSYAEFNNSIDYNNLLQNQQLLSSALMSNQIGGHMIGLQQNYRAMMPDSNSHLQLDQLKMSQQLFSNCNNYQQSHDSNAQQVKQINKRPPRKHFATEINEDSEVENIPQLDKISKRKIHPISTLIKENSSNQQNQLPQSFLQLQNSPQIQIQNQNQNFAIKLNSRNSSQDKFSQLPQAQNPQIQTQNDQIQLITPSKSQKSQTSQFAGQNSIQCIQENLIEDHELFDLQINNASNSLQGIQEINCIIIGEDQKAQQNEIQNQKSSKKRYKKKQAKDKQKELKEQQVQSNQTIQDHAEIQIESLPIPEIEYENNIIKIKGINLKEKVSIQKKDSSQNVQTTPIQKEGKEADRINRKRLAVQNQKRDPNTGRFQKSAGNSGNTQDSSKQQQQNNDSQSKVLDNSVDCINLQALQNDNNSLPEKIFEVEIQQTAQVVTTKSTIQQFQVSDFLNDSQINDSQQHYLNNNPHYYGGDTASLQMQSQPQFLDLNFNLSPQQLSPKVSVEKKQPSTNDQREQANQQSETRQTRMSRVSSIQNSHKKQKRSARKGCKFVQSNEKSTTLDEAFFTDNELLQLDIPQKTETGLEFQTTASQNQNSQQNDIAAGPNIIANDSE